MNKNENEVLLIGFGNEAEAVLIRSFREDKVITAPFADEISSPEDWLGEAESVIFAVKEIFNCHAAGVVVSRQDKTLLVKILQTGLSFKALELPISPELKLIGRALYQERSLRWDMEDSVERVRSVFCRMANLITTSSVNDVIHKFLEAESLFTQSHKKLIEELHLQVRVLLLSPSELLLLDDTGA